MIKAIFFDIDGTLLSHQSGKISLSTRRALDRLKEKGILLFAATGRHMLELEDLPVDNLSFDGYVSLNGQICLNAEKSLLYDVPINTEDTRKMLTVFEQKQIPVMLVELNRMYINFINEKVRAAQKAISTPVPEIGTYKGDKIYQFILYENAEAMRTLTEQFSNCKICEWNPHAFDMIPEKGGKVAGIKKLLKDHHITRDEIMAFGDGENDIDMLQYAGIGIAMGNAGEKIKNCADYVTSDVDRSGVENALKFYGIL